MTNFFIDLWHDLREKRLWPVAVGLLAAIVAVPAILFKPASEATPPPAAVPKTGSTDALPVVSVASGPIKGSKLEAFDEKNPFKPMKDLAKENTADSGSPNDGGGAGGGGAPTGGGTTPLGGTPSGSGGDGSAPSGGSSPSTGGSTPGNSGGQTVQWFHYVANFRFGEAGKKRDKFKNAASFTLLPDDDHPSIAFMGVSDDHKSAVFFIADPAFQAAGEGHCNAAGAACRFVTLKVNDADDEENFTAIDGSISYSLKLLRIKREDVGTDADGNPQPGKSAKVVAAAGEGVATTAETSASVLPAMVATGPAVGLEQK